MIPRFFEAARRKGFLPIL